MSSGLTVAALAGAVGLIAAIVGATIAAEDRYVTEVELAPLFQQQQKLIEDNALRILYFQLDRAMAERRRIIEREEPTPQALLDTIARLCREISERGGHC